MIPERTLNTGIKCLACRRVHSAIGSAAAGVVVVRVEVVVREEETKPREY
jgi:hypothetical protein